MHGYLRTEFNNKLPFTSESRMKGKGEYNRQILIIIIINNYMDALLLLLLCNYQQRILQQQKVSFENIRI